MVEDLWSEDDIPTESEELDEAVSIFYDIASYPSDFTLAGIAEMFREGDISIPPYQRQYVWSSRRHWHNLSEQIRTRTDLACEGSPATAQRRYVGLGALALRFVTPLKKSIINTIHLRHQNQTRPPIHSLWTQTK